jgi:hypothetical protein
VLLALKRVMGGSVQGDGGTTPKTDTPVAVAVLSCPACLSTTRVPLGQGDLTCDCGAERRIVRIEENAPAAAPNE